MHPTWLCCPILLQFEWKIWLTPKIYIVKCHILIEHWKYRSWETNCFRHRDKIFKFVGNLQIKKRKRNPRETKRFIDDDCAQTKLLPISTPQSLNEKEIDCKNKNKANRGQSDHLNSQVIQVMQTALAFYFQIYV